MKTSFVGEHIIFYTQEKLHHNAELQIFLQSEEFQKILFSLSQKTVVVLWGDGTMLSAIREYSHLEIPFLGINFWTKWFLMHEKNFIENDFDTEIYPLLETHIFWEERPCSFYAFNEIDIRAGNGRIITLDITLWETSSLQIAWDGIILSTPSGSTGYNSSLWGPIIPHEVNAFVLSPKAPWKPKGQTSILFSQSQIVHIKNIWRYNTLEIYADSFLIYSGTGQSLQLSIKKSLRNIQFLIPSSAKKVWKNKVMSEQGFHMSK